MVRLKLGESSGTMGNESSKTKNKSKATPKAKEPVEYVNGKGWVDEDGNVVEAETGKARNRRALELVDDTMVEHEAKEQEVARAQRDAKEASPALTAEEPEKKGKKRKLGKLSPVVHAKEPAAQNPRSNVWELSDSSDEEYTQAAGSSSTGKRRKHAPQDVVQSQVDDQLEAEPPASKMVPTEGKGKPSTLNDLLMNTRTPMKNAFTQKAPSKGKASVELQTEKPSAVFKPRSARPWTVSMAIPGSILNNVARHDTKTILVGRIARAAAVWCVDEIVVYDDDPTNIPEKVSPIYRGKKKTKTEIMDSISESDIPYQNPDRFMVGLLEYADCPPHIRSALFPMCEPYKFVGMLAPLDTPSHTKPNEWIRFREGVAIETPSTPSKGKTRASNKESTYINCGLPYPVKVAYAVPPAMRLTVEFKDEEPPASWPHPSQWECESLTVDAVAPETPREEGGYYWGYKVRQAASFSDVFAESEYEDGYSFTIGTSERGVLLSDILPDAIAPRNRPEYGVHKMPDNFKHLLVAFGGVSGLEPVIANDPAMGGIKKEDAQLAFDYWVNLVQNQGSRTIRTEEAIEIGLAGLKGYLDYQYENDD